MSSKSGIRSQIRRKQKEVNQCEQIIIRITRELPLLEKQYDTWNQQRVQLSQDEATEVVAVRHQYEGSCAKRSQISLLDSVQNKVVKVWQTMEVIEEGRGCINHLKQHIDELEWEINRLDDELYCDDD